MCRIHERGEGSIVALAGARFYVCPTVDGMQCGQGRRLAASFPGMMLEGGGECAAEMAGAGGRRWGYVILGWANCDISVLFWRGALSGCHQLLLKWW